VQLVATHKMLDDGAFSAWSNTWQNATALYTILQRLAADGGRASGGEREAS
jgi:hypothetical protein